MDLDENSGQNRNGCQNQVDLHGKFRSTWSQGFQGFRGLGFQHSADQPISDRPIANRPIELIDRKPEPLRYRSNRSKADLENWLMLQRISANVNKCLDVKKNDVNKTLHVKTKKWCQLFWCHHILPRKNLASIFLWRQHGITFFADDSPACLSKVK